MKRVFWLFLVIGFSGSAQRVPVGKVMSHKITFKIKNAGMIVDGSFSDLEADINFDRKHPDKSLLSASVGVVSIKTGKDMRDRDLLARKYFYVEKYPRMKMVSKKIKALGDDRFTGIFDLTIRDVTKEVVIPFTYIQTKHQGTFKGTFTVDRRDFGVGGNSIILSDDVRIFIEVTTK